VSNVQKRGNYTPRRAREQRAYRLVLTGGTAGVIGIVSGVLWIFGAIGATLPLICLVIVAVCVFMFRSVTRSR
jgi:hypothetical protein